MKIELQEIPIQDIVQYDQNKTPQERCTGYIEKENEEGVYGMGGRLNIRPPYQREFVYNNTQRNAVIDSIMKDYPLNVLYWVINKDGTYEVLDGQQRLISLCQYTANLFTLNEISFENLQEDKKEKFLNYKLMVYFCEGTDSEKLDWFRIINIAGVKLTDQELRNAVYNGPWVYDAKKYFSKTSGPAYEIGGGDYLKGTANRQDYLETTIKWISNNNIEGYMSKNQHNESALELWNYFNTVIEWVKRTFTVYRKYIMKGIEFGYLYNKYGKNTYNPADLENEIKKLLMDDDVTNKKGIYEYVLQIPPLIKNESLLNIRAFTVAQKLEAYERQNKICIKCQKHFDIEDMEADHITPWSLGGKTIPSNCQMLCKDCNRKKSNI